MEHPIVRDMRECCYGVVPDGEWTQEGWGFVLHRGDHKIRVNVAGAVASFIQVSVTRIDHEPYAAIPFFRELSDHGTVNAYDDLGHHDREPFRGDGNLWLMAALEEALRYIERQGGCVLVPGG